MVDNDPDSMTNGPRNDLALTTDSTIGLGLALDSVDELDATLDSMTIFRAIPGGRVIVVSGARTSCRTRRKDPPKSLGAPTPRALGQMHPKSWTPDDSTFLQRLG